jgi:hypothetical protein
MALSHMDQFCREFFPRGVLSPQGGYWFVYERGIKISLKMGGFLNLEADDYPEFSAKMPC